MVRNRIPKREISDPKITFQENPSCSKINNVQRAPIPKCYLIKWLFKYPDIQEPKIILIGMNRENLRESISSSPIVERISDTVLKAENGVVYSLCGEIDDFTAKILGYPTSLVDQFRKGFPLLWKKVLTDFYTNEYKDNRDFSFFNELYQDGLKWLANRTISSTTQASNMPNYSTIMEEEPVSSALNNDNVNSNDSSSVKKKSNKFFSDEYRSRVTSTPVSRRGGVRPKRGIGKYEIIKFTPLKLPAKKKLQPKAADVRNIKKIIEKPVVENTDPKKIIDYLMLEEIDTEKRVDEPAVEKIGAKKRGRSKMNVKKPLDEEPVVEKIGVKKRGRSKIDAKMPIDQPTVEKIGAKKRGRAKSDAKKPVDQPDVEKIGAKKRGRRKMVEKIDAKNTMVEKIRAKKTDRPKVGAEKPARIKLVTFSKRAQGERSFLESSKTYGNIWPKKDKEFLEGVLKVGWPQNVREWEKLLPNLARPRTLRAIIAFARTHLNHYNPRAGKRHRHESAASNKSQPDKKKQKVEHLQKKPPLGKNARKPPTSVKKALEKSPSVETVQKKQVSVKNAKIGKIVTSTRSQRNTGRTKVDYSECFLSRSESPKKTVLKKRLKQKSLTLKQKRQQTDALKMAAVDQNDDGDMFRFVKPDCRVLPLKVNLLMDNLSCATTPQSTAGASRFFDKDLSVAVTTPNVSSNIVTPVSKSIIRKNTVQYVHGIQKRKPKEASKIDKLVRDSIKSSGKFAGKKRGDTVKAVSTLLKDVEEKRKKLNRIVANCNDSDRSSIADVYFTPDSNSDISVD